jgi:hypothetical protein
MKPIPFREADGVLAAPDNWDEKTQGKCVGMPVYRPDGQRCISVWELSPAEIEAVKQGGKIAIAVHSGNTQPPISLWVTPPPQEEKQNVTQH